MKIGKLDTDERIVVVAEIGNNHEGDFGLAKEMVSAAAEAGADVVKFQTFRTEHYVSGSNSDRFRMLKGFELTYDQFSELKEHAEGCGAAFLSTPFDIESARFLNTISSAFKIASGDNSFYPLLETVAAFGKPVILSCGLASILELQYATSLIRRIWNEKGVCPGLATLHCVTSYPTPPESANLKAISSISEATCSVPGYSDHTLGIEACVLAAACGARIIEKHFTLDHQLSDFHDHQLSANPEEFRDLVERVRKAEVLLGGGDKALASCEKDIKPVVRRGIAAAKDMAEGSVVRLEDITWVRPSGDFSPGEECKVLGKTLARNVTSGELLTETLLK